VKELRLEQDQSSGLWIIKKGKWRVGQYVFSDKKKAENHLQELKKSRLIEQKWRWKTGS